MTQPDSLFQPVQLGALSLPNRVLMAPMTRSRATNPDLAAGSLQARYYAQRASAGLIVTEGTQVSRQGIGYVSTPGIHSAAQIKGWREVTRSVHAAGGRILAQLWHVGRISHTDFQEGGQPPVAPSALAAAGQTWTSEGQKPFSTPRALGIDEIAGVVDDFAKGARNALEAGFDGVQIHGANGYLVDQFLRDGSNQRTDGYGGSAENRARFLAEVTEAVVGVWGPGRVSVRLSPKNADFNGMQDSDPLATFSVAASRLAGFELAYLEGVTMGSPDAPVHTMLRESYGGNYVANGGFDRTSAASWLDDGRADAISFGSSFLANPDLPWRLLHGIPLETPDRATLYQGGEEGFLTYPSAGFSVG